jgi:hypothetical protein
MPPRLSGTIFSICIVLVAVPASTQQTDTFPPLRETSTGERELEALVSAYPDRVTGVAFRDDDWALLMDGRWYYWAHGRILPEEERSQWEQYEALRFEDYFLGGLPPIPRFDEENAARLLTAIREEEAHSPERWDGFLDQLFQAGTRPEAVSHIVVVNFLGFPVEVHERIAPALKNAALACDALRARDPAVRAFFAALKEIDGFNYRDIAGTKSRSYHGYGLAIDMIPKSYAGKQTYWRWSAGWMDDWWAIPYEKRWMVPQAVVSAFEDNGFVWGGKWLFFDTMHFEYRPEILSLSRSGNFP